MACTVAVEESIAHHYNNQIRMLMEEDAEKYEELLQVTVCLCGETVCLGEESDCVLGRERLTVCLGGERAGGRY